MHLFPNYCYLVTNQPDIIKSKKGLFKSRLLILGIFLVLIVEILNVTNLNF